jgi:hypothetical protein
MPRLALLLALVSLAGGVTAAPATAKTTVGVADQTADTFADPLFGGLGVRHARINLAWDALQYDWQVADLDAWMAGAQATGVKPLVIFSQSRIQGRTRILPTVPQYRKAFTDLRKRYPFLTEFAAWNEMNYPGQPSFRNPRRVAQFYKLMRGQCASCTILPGSLLDNPNMVPWAKRLNRQIIKQGQPAPKIWGLHNYSDVNRLSDRSTAKLLKAIPGQVWLTETGGVVRATSKTARKYPQGAPYAGRVATYILKTMVARHPRIKRVYFYEWKAPAGTSWDSGLVSPAGDARPAYNVVKSYIGR